MNNLPKMDAIYNLPWFYCMTTIIIILGIICYFISKLFNEKNKETFTIICIAGLLIVLCLSFVGDIGFQIKKAENTINKKLPMPINAFINVVKVEVSFRTVHYYYRFNDNANDQELATIFKISRTDFFTPEKLQGFCILFRHQYTAGVPLPQNIIHTFMYKDKTKDFILYKEDCKNQ